MKGKLLRISVTILILGIVHSQNLLDKIKADPNLSEFAQLVAEGSLLSLLLESKEYTAFVPTNAAMAKYDGPKTDDLIHYHLANIAYKIEELPEEVTSDLSGNPVLYVTKTPSGKASITGWENDNVYINNAKIVSGNIHSESKTGHFQYLHTVDEVIRPTLTQLTGSEARQYKDPTARTVVENSNVFDFTDQFSLRDFNNRASELKALDNFERDGKNTFFIPVDQALQMVLKTDKALVDKLVVMGHVVPDHVLFTRTVTDDHMQYQSLAFTDELEVFISMENVTRSDDEEPIYYVKSNTVKSDANHMKGSALARIIKANIPVKNGVMHLIDRPLMVVAQNIISYLQEDGGQLSRFYQLMKDHYSDLTNHLMSKEDITLFAPSDKAFDLVDKERFDKIIANQEKLKIIFQMHIINRRLTTDEIIEKSSNNQVFEEESMSPNRKLFFSAKRMESPVPMISVEGGGVSATISTPNIATKNGVIHIVDRIFGIPSQTVFEKLSTDPMLSSTYNLSQQGNWDLNDRNKKFTLFVPNNNAWAQIKRNMPSAFKKMFMGEFPSHVRSILQRHMIANDAYELEELLKITAPTNSTPVRENMRQTQLQMTRGKIYFQARIRQNFGDDQDYYVEWHGVSARVVRPDVECVNGIVHVIDQVLMAESDVTVSGSDSHVAGMAATLVTAIMSVTLAWFFM